MPDAAGRRTTGCESVYPPSASGPYSDERGWSGPLRCVIGEHQPHDQPPLHMNSGITWRESPPARETT